MAAGFEHRAVGCHDINAHSSRSHCLLIVGVTGTNISNGVRTVGKLTLCDLAGSERINKTGATGAHPLPTDTCSYTHTHPYRRRDTKPFGQDGLID